MDAPTNGPDGAAHLDVIGQLLAAQAPSGEAGFDFVKGLRDWEAPTGDCALRNMLWSRHCGAGRNSPFLLPPPLQSSPRPATSLPQIPLCSPLHPLLSSHCPFSSLPMPPQALRRTTSSRASPASHPPAASPAGAPGIGCPTCSAWPHPAAVPSSTCSLHSPVPSRRQATAALTSSRALSARRRVAVEGAGRGSHTDSHTRAQRQCARSQLGSCLSIGGASRCLVPRIFYSAETVCSSMLLARWMA